ncbi:hypothetical protein GCM10022254_09940 [Actinomadura meridiana]|uniref:Uncharacterized protein n=1 Tax=Actinomadura meridiana TaxID=559626 RepID=A0ABP8BTU1_9ACTN
MMIHIAGPVIVVHPGYMRQRCSWCGTVLVDYNLERVAVPEGQEPTPATWEFGGLVEVDGGMSTVVPHADGEPLPAGACALLDPAVTA